jgi:purine-binding chemotaxis protein CheW
LIVTALIKQEKMLPTAAAAATRQYLTFSLDGEIYAVETLCVKEIIEYGHLTVVPMAPPSVRGVINLRGAVVPVIDLLARFGKGVTTVARRSCIVILEIEENAERVVLGAIVDAVNEVLEITAGKIEPPPTFGARIRVDFIQGMGRVGHGFVILLDVEKLLSIDDLAMLAGGNELLSASPPALPAAQEK